MNARRMLSLVVLALFLVALMGLMSDVAYAQSSNQDLMKKKGIAGLFAGKNKKDERAPTNAQKYLGLGSLLVMVIVVKYL